MKKVLIQNLPTRRQTRQLSEFWHGQSWENHRQLCHHPVPLPRWEPANAPGLSMTHSLYRHGTYTLERSWKAMKAKVWESCFPYESIVHSNLLEAISSTDRNMIAILSKPFFKSKLHQQCPASCLHHSRNVLKFNTVTLACFPLFSRNQVTVPYSPPLALQRRSNLQENQVTCWVL